MANPVIYWIGPANRETFGAVAKQIGELLSKEKPREIDLIMDSGGGHVDIGLSAAGAIKRLGLVVNTCVYGYIDSALLPLFVLGRDRFIAKTGVIELNGDNTSFGDEVVAGFVQKEGISLGTFKRQSFADLISSVTKKKFPADKIVEAMKKDTLIFPDRAIDLGLATQII